MPLTAVTPSPSQSAALLVAFAAGVAVGANWPKIRKSVAPILAVAGDKAGDIYSAIAEAIGEQKEAMEDSRAERRHRGRSKKAAAGGEQELLASLAAALLKGKRRAAAKPARKRASGRTRKVGVPAAQAVGGDGNP
jgi:hypothetical protein